MNEPTPTKKYWRGKKDSWDVIQFRWFTPQFWSTFAAKIHFIWPICRITFRITMVRSMTSSRSPFRRPGMTSPCRLAMISTTDMSCCRKTRIRGELSWQVVLNVGTTAAHQRWIWTFWCPTLHFFFFLGLFYTFNWVKMNLFGCYLMYL